MTNLSVHLFPQLLYSFPKFLLFTFGLEQLITLAGSALGLFLFQRLFEAVKARREDYATVKVKQLDAEEHRRQDEREDLKELRKQNESLMRELMDKNKEIAILQAKVEMLSLTKKE